MQDFSLSIRFTCTPIKIPMEAVIMPKWTDVPHQEPAQPGLGAWGPASQSSAGSAAAWTAPGCEASPSWWPVSTRVHRCISAWWLSASLCMSTWWPVSVTVHVYLMDCQHHRAWVPDVLSVSQCTSTWWTVSVTVHEYLIYCHWHSVWPSDVLSVPQYTSIWCTVRITMHEYLTDCQYHTVSHMMVCHSHSAHNCTDNTSASQCTSAWCSRKER